MQGLNRPSGKKMCYKCKDLRGVCLRVTYVFVCLPVKCSICKSVSDTYDPYLDIAIEIRVCNTIFWYLIEFRI